MFVLDTNILSAIMSARPSPEVAAWIAGHPEDTLFTPRSVRRKASQASPSCRKATAALLLKRRLKPYSQTISTGTCSRSTRRPQRPALTFSPPKGLPPDRAARSHDRSCRARQRCRRGHARYRRFRRLRCPTSRSVAGFILKRPSQDDRARQENVRWCRAWARGR